MNTDGGAKRAAADVVESTSGLIRVEQVLPMDQQEASYPLGHHSQDRPMTDRQKAEED